MRREEREAALAYLKERLPAGWVASETGCAIRVNHGYGSPPEDGWFIDCPSWAGSTGRRKLGRWKIIGKVEGKDGYIWTEEPERFGGKGWEIRAADALLANLAVSS